MLLETKNLSKNFKQVQAVKDVSFGLDAGEVLSIIGPSGSGKSTLLKLIANLEQPTEGDIYISGQSIQSADKKTKRALYQSMGFIFQDFALFEHLTVKENLELAPKLVYKKNQDSISKETNRLLKLVGLEDKIDAYPITLSGGQKQRIAIARALATSPKILLFDEPTSALDVKSIDDLVDIILKLKKAQIGILIVTHDLRFAKLVSSRLLFMKNSSIIFSENIQNIENFEQIFDDFLK
ncbi:amino acid ABC transporter ATP-binding protein [Paracholeplasma manati]|uniref:ATP-binding cassette domain-containing protein n=1 Tax=Paracholeplasma manati TaxID=591373 RepID=A0ABT2Y8I0_9MOLU|nr:ATP-binding cassette domain-containing protein [Paracholeplasma manati]MCV2232335.1 ATP-binding cassette domain-containing protein [Paracholeplasma manati]MDG0888292.1 ATP-binding cassette domain-containing protein [Paracholeplasma manati]